MTTKAADAVLTAGLEQAFRMGAEKGAREVVRLERQRDELLAACGSLDSALDALRDDIAEAADVDTQWEAVDAAIERFRAAISKAKEGR
jgi:hypothetical protein